MVSPTKLIQGTLLTAGAVLYYTAPGKTSTIIKKLTVTNIDVTNAHAFTLWLVPAGGGVVNPDLLIFAKSIGPKGTYDCIEAQNHVLKAGDAIYAQGDDAINLQIQASGVEIV